MMRDGRSLSVICLKFCYDVNIMDNLTHTLLGIVVARSGLRKRFGAGTTTVLALASNLPDLDLLTILFRGKDYFLFRRMFTHSLLGMGLLSFFFAFIAHRFYKHLSWKNLFGLSLLGVGLHILLDLLNSYGVVLLYPWSFHRFELAWVFVIDFIWWAILLFPFLAASINFLKPRKIWAYRLCILTTGFYIAFCGWSHSLGLGALNQWAKQKNMHPNQVYLFPEALGSHRFQGVLREGDEYRLFWIYPFSHRCDLKKNIHTDQRRPEVQKLRTLPKVQMLEWFFKAPVWKYISEGGPEGAENKKVKLEFYDLRFDSLLFPWRYIPFSFEFDIQSSKADVQSVPVQSSSWI